MTDSAARQVNAQATDELEAALREYDLQDGWGTTEEWIAGLMALVNRFRPEAASVPAPAPSEAPQPKKTCKYGDPSCPCQDGDMCHYEGKNAWPVPSEAPQKRPSGCDWVNCPVCGQTDMQRKPEGDDGFLICCVNTACLSNGGTFSNIGTELKSAHRLWEKDHDELVKLRKIAPAPSEASQTCACKLVGRVCGAPICKDIQSYSGWSHVHKADWMHWASPTPYDHVGGDVAKIFVPCTVCDQFGPDNEEHVLIDGHRFVCMLGAANEAPQKEEE